MIKMKCETIKKASVFECPLCRVPTGNFDEHIEHEHGMKKDEMEDFLEYVVISREKILKMDVLKGLCMTFWIYALIGMWISLLFLSVISGLNISMNTGLLSVSFLTVGSALILKSEIIDDE